jgi:hypothetical protein
MGNLLGGGKPPGPPKAVRIPNAQDADVQVNRASAQQDEEKKRKGRRSTNLVGSSPTYTRTTLG